MSLATGTSVLEMNSNTHTQSHYIKNVKFTLEQAKKKKVPQGE
jgi:hypothetical protein